MMWAVYFKPAFHSTSWPAAFEGHFHCRSNMRHYNKRIIAATRLWVGFECRAGRGTGLDCALSCNHDQCREAATSKRVRGSGAAARLWCLCSYRLINRVTAATLAARRGRPVDCGLCRLNNLTFAGSMLCSKAAVTYNTIKHCDKTSPCGRGDGRGSAIKESVLIKLAS